MAVSGKLAKMDTLEPVQNGAALWLVKKIVLVKHKLVYAGHVSWLYAIVFDVVRWCFA